MSNRKLSMYMTKNPINVSHGDSLKKVMETMERGKLSHLLVVDNDIVKGVISKVDILKKIKYLLGETTGSTYSKLATTAIKASEIMTSDFISVSPNDSVEYGVELLLQKEFHCLPVIENGKPVGIITFYDLLKGYYQEAG